MARIQQSIEINVPAQAAYHQFTRFEEYPRFMQDVEEVRQSDDTHLHWSTSMAAGKADWDAEITEQMPDRCIAWRNTSGPDNAGRLEVEPVGREKARVTLTMECEPGDMLPPQAGSSEAAMAERLAQNLARFKKMVETRGAEPGGGRGNVSGASGSGSGAPDAAPVAASGYAAGSEGWDGSEDAGEPAVSSAGTAQDSRQSGQAAVPQPFGLQSPETMQSAASLSRSPDDQPEDGRDGIAEEVNLDQQSDQARRVGQMPQSIGGAASGGMNPADAIAKTMQSKEGVSSEEAALAQSMERAVPPSDEPQSPPK